MTNGKGCRPRPGKVGAYQESFERIFMSNIEHWNAAAALHGTSDKAGWPDTQARVLERARIYDYLESLGLGSTPTVADVGCGNGAHMSGLKYSFKHMAFTGYDRAPGMIAKAREKGLDAYLHNISVAPVDEHDVVMSIRCLCNGEDEDEQEAMLENLALSVKPGGKLILLEPSVQRLGNLNGLRTFLGLSRLSEPTFNVYPDEDHLRQTLHANGLKCRVKQGYMGTYYMMTRALTSPKGFDSELSLLARKAQEHNGTAHEAYSVQVFWEFTK